MIVPVEWRKLIGGGEKKEREGGESVFFVWDYKNTAVDVVSVTRQ